VQVEAEEGSEWRRTHPQGAVEWAAHVASAVSSGAPHHGNVMLMHPCKRNHAECCATECQSDARGWGASVTARLRSRGGAEVAAGLALLQSVVQ
jgi:hypothetical protein